MDYLIKILVLTFVFQNNIAYSQFIKTEHEIFVTILKKQVGNGATNFYLSCNKPKTFFMKEIFLEQTTLKNIPKNILLELVKNSEDNIKDELWSCRFIKKLNFAKDFLASRKCLKENEIKNKLKINQRTTIFEISKPIFDFKKIHCIVDLVVSETKGEFFSTSFFLKKIYGKWVILAEFDFVMS